MRARIAAFLVGVLTVCGAQAQSLDYSPFSGGTIGRGLTIDLRPLANQSRALTTYQSPTGTSVSSLNLNQFSIGTTVLDDVDAGGNFVNGWLEQHHFGGSNAKGGRQTHSTFLFLDSPTNSANTNRNYVANVAAVYARSGDGGTNLTSGKKGAIFGFNPVAVACGTATVDQCTLGVNATNLLEVAGSEVNYAVATGASTYLKAGFSIVAFPYDAVQGASFDAGLSLSAQSGAVGHVNGILFSDANGQQPLASNGTLIASQDAGTVASGIDFSSYTFSGSGNYLKFPAFSVSNIGAQRTYSLSVGNAALGGTAASAWLLSSAGALGTTATNELTAGSIGFTSTNAESLGIVGYRNSTGSDWTTTSILLEMDVDNTKRAGSNGAAYLSLGSNGNVGIGTKLGTSKLEVAGGVLLNGAVSAANWGSSGVGLATAAATYTDTSSSGTVSANQAINVFARPTVAASSTTTYSGNYATVQISNAPLAGTNATISNPRALHVPAGGVLFDGGLTVDGGGVTIATTANINASNNAVSNIGTGSTTSTVTIGGGSNAVVINSTASGSETTGSILLKGSSSGTVSELVQAAAGTFNWNLPITAGASGDFLTSGGGSSTAMTWTTPGTGVATFIATPTSANLAAALTNETGSGAAVFGTSPTIATPAITGTGTYAQLNGTSTSSTCLTQGANGTTNPVLQIDCSVGSQATGVKLTGNAAGTAAALVAISSGTNEDLGLAGKGTGGVAITGRTSGAAAAAGKVGEVIKSYVVTGSAVSLTTATAANVTSISLTAGDWDVCGAVNFKTTAATSTVTLAGISTTSATMPTDGTEVYSGVQLTLTTTTDGISIPCKQVNVSATTTAYLEAQATFSAGNISAFGQLFARRKE